MFSTPIPIANPLSTKEIYKLPANFEDIITTYNLPIGNKEINELLLTGYIYIENPTSEAISENTPLTITSENIQEYISQEINIVEEKIKYRIEKELIKEIQKQRFKVLFIYPISEGEEKTILLNVLTNNIERLQSSNIERFLSLTNDSKRNFSLLNVHKEIGESNIPNEEISQIKNQTNVVDEQEYIEQLRNYIEQKRKHLQSLDIYNNDYEEVLLKLDEIQNKDKETLSKILSEEYQHNIFWVNKDGLLSLSKTNRIYQNAVLNNDNFNIGYDIQPNSQTPNTVRIPILMYHHIGYPPEGSSKFVSGLYTSPEIFEEQIAYLTKKNYKTLNSKDFLQILSTNQNPSQKSILLTFDDGTSSHYSQAYKILKKYNQVGIFFVTSNRSQLSTLQLKEMASNGMDIQSHSQTHPDLSKISDSSRIQSEIGGSKTNLEARTGYSVISIAYPGCAANSYIFKSVANNGYQLGFSCGKSIDHRYSSRLSLSRVHNPNNLDDLKKILSGIYPF